MCFLSYSVLVSVVDFTLVSFLLCIRAHVGFAAADVLQLLFDFLMDEGLVRKEVFHKWASAAALQGKEATLNSVDGLFSRRREPEYGSSAVTLSWPRASERKSIWSKHSRSPADPFKQRSRSL